MIVINVWMFDEKFQYINLMHPDIYFYQGFVMFKMRSTISSSVQPVSGEKEFVENLFDTGIINLGDTIFCFMGTLITSRMFDAETLLLRPLLQCVTIKRN